MATFPRLKTSAVAQYPAKRTIAFRNQTVRFLDGRDQRYRDSGLPVRRWVVALENIDESEAAALEEFFVGQQGAFGSFEFTDPWDGVLYEDCSFAIDAAEFTAHGEMQTSTRLVIQENEC